MYPFSTYTKNKSVNSIMYATYVPVSSEDLRDISLKAFLSENRWKFCFDSWECSPWFNSARDGIWSTFCRICFTKVSRVPLMVRISSWMDLTRNGAVRMNDSQLEFCKQKCFLIDVISVSFGVRSANLVIKGQFIKSSKKSRIFRVVNSFLRQLASLAISKMS